ncbi:MAG TPA: hypothetical protein VMT87_10790 [Vicinamibacteria bacterium]|nr:hypothetical protein [Vicinamibacteria bacterium]
MSLLALAALDLARAYAGRSLRPFQWAAGLLAVAAVWWLMRSRGSSRREAWPVGVLCLFLVPLWVDHARQLQSDGIMYYAFLRSVLFDGDLHFSNDFALLGWPDIPNVLPVGAPLLWSPFVATTHLLRQAARLFGAGEPTGVEPLYQATACLATVVYGSAGLLLLPGALKRWVIPAAAFWATVLCWVGSPLRFYLSVLPGLAHGVEFFAAVLVLRAWLSLRDRVDVRRAALCGAACGLVFLARSQDGLLLLAPAVEIGRRLFRRGEDRRRLLGAGAALAGAFALVALPQIVVWQVTFHDAVLIPHQQIHGDQFLLPEPQLAGTLVSPRGGVFLNYPVLFVAFVGLLVLAFRDPAYVAAVLPVLLAGWYVNASVFDWYQVRRFTGVVPLLAPGLALVLVPLTRGGFVPVAVLAFAVWRHDLAVDALRRIPGDPAPLRAVVREAADGLAGDAYAILEPRAPRLAVRLLSAYTGEPLLHETVSRVDLDGAPSVLRLPRPARHLAAVEVEDGQAGRWVSDRETRLFLPVAWTGGVVVTVRARALETVEPQHMEALWNDVAAGRLAMTAAWGDYRFRVPAAAVRPGTNELLLRFDRAPIYRRIRGDGPREPRPAILSAITLHRAHE